MSISIARLALCLISFANDKQGVGFAAVLGVVRIRRRWLLKAIIFTLVPLTLLLSCVAVWAFETDLSEIVRRISPNLVLALLMFTSPHHRLRSLGTVAASQLVCADRPLCGRASPTHTAPTGPVTVPILISYGIGSGVGVGDGGGDASLDGFGIVTLAALVPVRLFLDWTTPLLSL